MGVRIVEVGWATTVQDAGRLGVADLGVPRAGAVDRRAHGLANRLVGNPEGRAALETAGGLRIEAETPLIVATSADGQRHTLTTGQRLTVETGDGQWGYLAVRGGVIVTEVLGSVAHDTLSAVGPLPLQSGQVLDVGPDPGADMPTDLAPPPPLARSARLWPGPRDAPDAPGIEFLLGRTWLVKEEANRVGVRLAPGAVRGATAPSPRSAGTGASEGLVEGAVQLTPTGEPIVMLANHPTTGGYPVIAVVEPDDLSVIAQARPGAELRFRRA